MSALNLPGNTHPGPLAGCAVCRVPAETRPLVLEVDLGAIWLTRDAEQVRIDRHEVAEVVRSLLTFADQLDDAADGAP